MRIFFHSHGMRARCGVTAASSYEQGTTTKGADAHCLMCTRLCHAMPCFSAAVIAHGADVDSLKVNSMFCTAAAAAAMA
jgi:hypothetical protein